MKIKAESKSCSGHKRAVTVLTIDGGEGIVSLKADVKSDEFLDADSAVITSFYIVISTAPRHCSATANIGAVLFSATKSATFPMKHSC